MPPANAGATIGDVSGWRIEDGGTGGDRFRAASCRARLQRLSSKAPKEGRMPASSGALNLYARIDGTSFPVLAVKLSDVGRQFLRKVVTQTKYARPRSNYQVSTYETIPR